MLLLIYRKGGEQMKEWLGNIKLTDISIIIVMLAGITTFIKNLLDIIDRLKKKKTKNRKPKKRQKKKRK
jgi:hypothetical protein